MTSFTLAAALTAALAASVRADSPLPLPWGRYGHTIAARVAVQSLPAEMPAFFRDAADQLVYLNVEPDRWRDSSREVMDASQPHHTTIHCNGWASGAPNPEGFTTSRDFHSRFESAFVTAHMTEEDIRPRIEPRPRRLGDIRREVMRYIRDSNGQVERLYRLEKEVGFDPDTADPQAEEFVAERLATGVEMLRAVWWSAWLRSGEHPQGDAPQ